MLFCRHRLPVTAQQINSNFAHALKAIDPCWHGVRDNAGFVGIDRPATIGRLASVYLSAEAAEAAHFLFGPWLLRAAVTQPHTIMYYSLKTQPWTVAGESIVFCRMFFCCNPVITQQTITMSNGWRIFWLTVCCLFVHKRLPDIWVKKCCTGTFVHKSSTEHLYTNGWQTFQSKVCCPFVHITIPH